MLSVEVFVTYEHDVEVYGRNMLWEPKDKRVISTLVNKEKDSSRASISNSLLYEGQRVQGVNQSHVRGEMQGTTLENKEIIQGTGAPKSCVTSPRVGMMMIETFKAVVA